MIDAEFNELFSHLPESGCAKKQTAAGTWTKAGFIYAVNRCEFIGETCPRLNLPSGTGYELCAAKHAEANLAEILKQRGLVSDGVAWVASIGVKEIRVRETLV
jgi:hypothetical protein